jgi:hypothetical protein
MSIADAETFDESICAASVELDEFTAMPQVAVTPEPEVTANA